MRWQEGEGERDEGADGVSGEDEEGGALSLSEKDEVYTLHPQPSEGGVP